MTEDAAIEDRAVEDRGPGDHERLGPQAPVDGVVMQVGGAPPAARGIAVGQHLQDLLEFLRRQLRVRRGATKGLEQFRYRPFAAGDLGDDLLREHVQRLLRHADPVELAAAHAVEERRAFDEVVQ